MTDSIVHLSPGVAPHRKGSITDRLARRVLLKLGHRLTECELTITDPEGTYRFGSTSKDGLRATIQVRDLSFYSHVALRGSIGAGEAFVLGLWECDDLVALMRVFARNAATLDAIDSGFSRLTQPAYRVAHALRRNTVAGSRKNILAHYDLGNDFYELLLDETLSYSSGIFPSAESTLLQASVNKLDRICKSFTSSPMTTWWRSEQGGVACRFTPRGTTAVESRRRPSPKNSTRSRKSGSPMRDFRTG